MATEDRPNCKHGYSGNGAGCETCARIAALEEEVATVRTDAHDRIRDLEAENARLRDEIQNTRLSDFSPEVQEKAAFRLAYVAAWDAEWRAQGAAKLVNSITRFLTEDNDGRDVYVDQCDDVDGTDWWLARDAFLAAHGGGK